MSAFVRETADGWEVVDGETVTKPASQVEALDAALATYSVAKKTTVLRDADSGTPNGSWRWIHAGTAEAEAKDDGKRLAESSLDQAIAHLNASPRARVIDGGAADSDTHGSEFTAGATLATGWAHAAIRAINLAGNVCVFVWAEVLASIADALDTGRLAFASLAIRGRKGPDGTMLDSRFSSMALTNLAVTDDLQPTSAIRADLLEVRLTAPARSVRSSPREIPMPNLSLRTRLGAGHLALRGPAIDKVVQVAKSLGVDPEVEFASSEWDSPTSKAWCAIRSAAMAEKILEAVPAVEQAAVRAQLSHDFRSALGLRAEVPDADLEKLAKAAGLEAGAPIADIIAAVEKMKPAEAPPAPKPDDTATRSEKALEDRLAKAEERLAKGEARELRIALRGQVDEALTAAKATMSIAERDELVEDLAALPTGKVRDRHLAVCVRSAVGAPPHAGGGSVLPKAPPSNGDPLAAGDPAKLIEAEVAALRAEKPDLAEPQLRREAYVRAATKTPAAF